MLRSQGDRVDGLKEWRGLRDQAGGHGDVWAREDQGLRRAVVVVRGEEGGVPEV